jgi:hypothetical protein
MICLDPELGEPCSGIPATMLWDTHPRTLMIGHMRDLILVCELLLKQLVYPGLTLCVLLTLKILFGAQRDRRSLDLETLVRSSTARMASLRFCP